MTTSGEDGTGSQTEVGTSAGERGASPNCELLAAFTGPAADELERRLSERRP